MQIAKDLSHSNRENRLSAELWRWKDILVKQYQPEKIILFGSMANHSVSEWSDIDLVIVKKTDKRFLDRIKDVLCYIQPKVGADIIVYTPDEFERLSEERDFVKTEILGKGIVLYEK